MSYCLVNGIQIFYRESGQGQPLVLLHGLGSCSDDWDSQVAFLERYYRVITVDFRGHGRSEKPDEPYSVPLYAAEVLGVLEKLKVEQAHLVGFSLGGMVAFQLAVDNPNAWLSLAIVNSGPAVDAKGLLQKFLVWRRKMVIHLAGMKAVGRLIGKNLFPGEEQRELYDRFLKRLQETPKYAYLRALTSFVGWSVEDSLSQLAMPVLVLTADQDYTSVACKERYCRKMPNAKMLVIENSRHATPMDQPEKFNRELLRFLESVPVSPACD